MEIKLKDRTFTIPDDCPLDGPKKSTLRRNLQEHGAESFLTSRKLSPFAGCLTDELLKAGAEIVEPDDPINDEDPEPQEELESAQESIADDGPHLIVSLD